MHRVFVTRQLPGDAVERLRASADVDVWPGDMPPPYDELARHAASADGLICLLTDRIDRALIDGAPRLRVISTMAVGYDNIDVAAATTRGIPVGHTPGVLTETTADLAFALILACARRIVEAECLLRDGRWRTWDPGLLLGHDVHGATLGIVGFGKIGQAVARRAAGFGMRVVYASRAAVAEPHPPAERVPLEELLRVADFVSLHVPLTDETRGLIGGAELRSMKPTAILINTARGGIVDQAALVRALEERSIAGAGLDVMETEPLSLDDPLLRAPNVVLLPHIGSASHATRTRMASMAVDNCLAGLRGEQLPHRVNPEN
ncbi:MAG: D-glycerate dehydrogenase [Dehalococcoidia bacterium]|nr:MAG: D-glycerate dehydrogenase [Dehalococcoidia bacterium]